MHSATMCGPDSSRSAQEAPFLIFIVSNLLLPVGSLIYLLFCTSKWGWGFKNYQAEANKGGGLKVPDWVRVYLSYILPLLLLVLIVQGLIG